MANLKFADTHNMVAFLSKPEESDGFEQIVDFLNAHPIKYALTVNPTIYISCIEQFWSTVKAKTINGEVQLHALVDGKKIIITESTVRRDLQLEDAEGVDCLPNSTIFEQLTLMGSKTTAWNEFSSTMASAIICLATNQKFNFSKYIFESMIRNLDNLSGKFLMYPRYALTVNPTIYTSGIEQFWSTVKAKTINGEVQLHALVDGKKIIVTESTIRRDLQLEDAKGIDCLLNSTIFEEHTRMGAKTTAWNEFSSTMTSAIICLATNQKFNFSKYIFKSMVKNLDNVSGNFLMYPRKPKRKDSRVPQPSGPKDIVADEAVHKELGDRLVRAATTASSLEAEQDRGNITKTRSKATPNESSSLGTTSGGGPKCQETMGDIISQTVFENVSKHSNDSLLARGNTLRSDDDSLKLKELMELCTNLQTRVLDFEKIKTTQQIKIDSLKRRVKKCGCIQIGGGINAINVDEDITLVNVQDDFEMFDVNTLTGDEVFAEQEVAAKDVNLTIDEVTLAQALAALKSVKPKVKGVVIQEPSTTTTTTISSQQLSHDKGKGIMVEEPVKTMKKKDLIRLDEDIASKLQAKFDEEERLAREKAKKEANVALIEEWDDIQAKIEADHELAQRLQQRRKHFTAKSAEEKRNKPPTQAQQRKIMCTYLKNMEGKMPKDLKNKSFDSIQKMFDRAFNRVNTFFDFRTDLVEGSSKRVGEELEQESTKKQKVDEDKDTSKL
ncbi:hypothetical protein Tco_0332595 [Tanacetum coccineum]